MDHRRHLAFVAALALAAGCDRQPTAPETTALSVEDASALSASAADAAARADLLAGLAAASGPEVALDLINQRLAAAGASIAVAKMEYVTGGAGADQAGQTVFANDRQLRLTSKWVPGDGRRLANGDVITQVTFAPFAPANFGTPQQIDGLPPIDASFETWNDVTCSNLDIQTLPPTNTLPSAIFAGGNPFLADISTMGFLPGAFFELVLGPGSSESVLGVTFTFVFIDGPGGPPTDVNNDGRNDTALKEVWYNDDFLWSTDGAPGSFDVETVALHENGHALELGHFGRIALGNKNGKLHVSPRAVMNAFILGTLRELLGTDNAAYCGNFGSWPN